MIQQLFNKYNYDRMIYFRENPIVQKLLMWRKKL